MLSILKATTRSAPSLLSHNSLSFQFASAQSSKAIKKAAVVLSGCGVFDGSEITEAVSLMIALSQNKIPFTVFAPDKDQTEVINHMTGEKVEESRNVLVEAARISRGNISDLRELKHADYDALFMPGGFGAAKNLSDFASRGSDMNVDHTVAEIIQEFHTAKKPIALACISPVLAAKVLNDKGVKLTLGDKGDEWPYEGAIGTNGSFGSFLIKLARCSDNTWSEARNEINT